MSGAGTDSCTVTLNAAAATGGFAASLSSNDGLSRCRPVTVAAGSTSTSFSATFPRSAPQTVTLTASANSVTQTFALQLDAGVPTLSINATSVAFGNVNLNSPQHSR